ncbi:M56 family peptidase [Dysgonomonas sp. 521]|uniref:M56 family metallopeptidase n=1 Tax=Dysgonomonas sp. 521 TaxID=2302932 RepID=UPI0013D35BAF|nr:M56 family metallopeptidase [Dysgonomonas sp. 521]NDV96823.1 M56 family peptidase [Dysgonomonas sp. 521]
MDNTIITYLIKASVSLALFYGLYILLLRTDTFFRLRRFYFLFSMTFSLLFPFFVLEIPIEKEAPVQMPVYWLSQIEVTAETAKVPSIDIWSVLLFALSAVTIISAVKFIIQLLSIIHLRIGNKSKKLEICRLIELKGKEVSPFSFFGWIFVGSQSGNNNEYDEIIAHELVHVRQLHSIDVLLAELFCILFWWNPFVWLMKKEIKINLEYLADEGVINAGFNSKEYQYIMLQTSNVNTGIPIINNFNVSQLKRRITMMNKNKTSVGKAAKYLLLVPVVLTLLLGNAVQASPDILTIPFVDGKQDPVKKGDVYVTVEKMPMFPGGLDAQAKFLAQTIKYPVEAFDKKIEGRVFVRYIVRSTGEISDVEVIRRGAHPDFDKEAIRVVKAMPEWEPGKQGGKAVDTYYTLPVVFRLSGNKSKVAKGGDDAITVSGYEEKQKGGPRAGFDLPQDGTPYVTVEKMPSFPGGESAMQKYVADNLKYPESAVKAGIQGRVTIRFVVGRTGEITDVAVIRGIDPECNAEAIRVIQSMPNWTPGMMNGEVVSVYYTLPIVFRLKEDTVVNTGQIE